MLSLTFEHSTGDHSAVASDVTAHSGCEVRPYVNVSTSQVLNSQLHA